MSAILQHLIKDHGVTLEQAKVALKGWEMRPIKTKALQVGEVMIKNNEIHFALERKFRLKMGRLHLMREFLSTLLAEKGFLVTKVIPSTKEAAIVKMMGFTRTFSSGPYEYYWMNDGDPIGRRTAKREALHDSH